MANHLRQVVVESGMKTSGGLWHPETILDSHCFGTPDSGYETMPVSNTNTKVATLQGLLDELSSRDLTLGRAKILRPRLFALLESMDSRNPGASDGAGIRFEVGISSYPRDAAATGPEDPS